MILLLPATLSSFLWKFGNLFPTIAEIVKWDDIICCRPRCHYYGRKLVKICQTKERCDHNYETLSLMWPLSVMSRSCQYLLFNRPLFSQTQGKRMKKIGCIVPDIFDVFTFFMQPVFNLEKGRLRRAATICRVAYFCKAQVTLYESVNIIWKCWVISKIHDPFFPLYLEKVEYFLESKTMVFGSDAAESQFLKRNLTLGVF